MEQAFAWWHLIDKAGLAALDQGPRLGIMSASTLQQILQPMVNGCSRERRDTVISLALLWHDHHEAAHHLCQAHEGDQHCDYVHALLHRREGDFANANYWFREVGRHPAYNALAKLPEALAVSHCVEQGEWQPAAMVAACAAVIRSGKGADKREEIVALQGAEFANFAAYLAIS